MKRLAVARALCALALIASIVVSLAACAPAEKPTLLGSWHAADTAGKSASLSDLTLTPDARFRYAGKNALGGPVAFTGSYRTGEDKGTPWIALIYDDYPDKPAVWFYSLEANQLTVSAQRGNLTNGSALVFTRQ
jgi:hypothetical protein